MTAGMCLPAGANGACGEWHDVVPLRSGDLAFVLGDAAGAAEAAEAVRRILAPFLHDLLLNGVRPVAALAAADDLLRRLPRSGDVGPHMPITAIACAVLALPGGQLTVFLLGHPSPVMVDARGDVTVLRSATPLPPLGCTVSATRLDAHAWRGRMRAGDLLLLCSDGLLERRDGDRPVRRLATWAGQLAHAPVGEACRQIVAVGADTGVRRDDRTALAVRLSAAAPLRDEAAGDGRAVGAPPLAPAS